MCECVRAALACALTVGSLVWMPGVARAQQANDTASSSYTDLSDYLVIGNQALPRQVAVPGPANLSSTVTQIGQGNVASATLSGIANVTNQFQSGAQNSSTLTVNGVQNAITTAQIGNGNATSISESLSLSYEEVKFEYTEQKADGTKGAVVQAGWNLAQNKKAA